MKICPNCHRPVNETSAYCPHCGTRLEEDADEYVEEELPTPRGSSNVSKRIMWTVISVALIVTLVLSCPDKKDHVEALNSVVTSYLDKKIYTDKDADGWTKLGQGVASLVMPHVLNSALEVDNYILFSVGKIKYDGEEKTVSIGVLGHVFTGGYKGKE